MIFRLGNEFYRYNKVLSAQTRIAMSIAALVVAAGTGNRLGGTTPKQYLPLGGQAVLRHSLATLAAHPAIDPLIVVINPDHQDLFAVSAADIDAETVIGASTRQESVRLGLHHLAHRHPKHVLIHDGARPFVNANLIDRVLAGLRDHDAVIPALPILDSIKRVSGDQIESAIDRTGLWRAQTPQGFHFDAIYRASGSASSNGNYADDAAIAAAAGIDVHTVDGDETNFKVTLPGDLERAERLLQARLGDIRVGSGFDTHRFVAGDRVRLCGIDIMAEAALGGHSDADVALHAVTDALLGAIGAGDIGSHFPPSDARWQDADSQIFLAHAADLIRAMGGIISNIDLTLICERPKIDPHRDKMRDQLANSLSLSRTRVSIKATTTERLGFTGRGEGIAAQATATVRLPS